MRGPRSRKKVCEALLYIVALVNSTLDKQTYMISPICIGHAFTLGTFKCSLVWSNSIQ